MMGLGLLGKVADLAGAVIDSKTVVKKAEAETKMKIATGEISWEQAAIKASDNSWKDEAWPRARRLAVTTSHHAEANTGPRLAIVARP